MASSRVRRAARAATAGFVALALTLAAPPPRAGASSPFRRIGTIAMELGHVVVPDAATRSLLVIRGGREPLSVERLDARALKRRNHAAFDDAWPLTGRAGRALVWSFDEKARRLHVLVYPNEQAKENVVAPSILTIDADTLRPVARVALPTIAPPGVRVLGMRLRPGGRAMLVLQTIPTASPPFLFAVDPRVAGVFVAEIDLAAGTTTWGPTPARGCQTAITNQTQADVAVRDGAVFVSCGTSQVLTASAPGVPAIVAITLADPSQQQVSFLPGSYGAGDVYVDEPGGRILLVSSTAGRPNQSVWVFDAEHRTFVGQIAGGESNVNGAGVNPVTGRVYVGIDGALLVTTDRGVEIPQATTLPLDLNIGPIVAVPFANAIVAPMKGPGGVWVFTLLEDRLSPSTFVAGTHQRYAALDDLTSETPQYSADAQAFGVRAHTIGGVNSLGQNAVALGGNYWRDPGNLTGLKDGDRDVETAKVVRAHLGEDEASAESIAAQPDANTASDYGTIARSDPRGETRDAWPFAAAGCRDFGSGEKEQHIDGEADAECKLARRRVWTQAAHGGVGSGATIVAASHSDALLQMRDDGTLAVEVHAEARSVSISGTVRIGYVSSDATVTAGPKATATYRRTFRNVEAGGFVCGEVCDAAEVLEAITAALGSQVRVELPAFEALSTKRGAHAHVVREPWAHQQDVVVNNQDPTEQQVAALRLTFVNDGNLASRLIVELAAVSATATVVRTVAAQDPEPLPTPEPSVVTVPLPTPDPEPTPDVPRAPDPKPVPKPPVVIAGHGWQLLTAGSFGQAVRSIALWMLFASPLFFAFRRRLLGRLRGGAS